MEKKLSHIDDSGGAAMVDVSNKEASVRTAIATGKVVFPEEVFKSLSDQDFIGKKGSIVQTAVIAGIQGVKKTAELIPLCHQINLSKIKVDIVLGNNELKISCVVRCTERTGVEMQKPKQLVFVSNKITITDLKTKESKTTTYKIETTKEGDYAEVMYINFDGKKGILRFENDELIIDYGEIYFNGD